MAMPVPLYLAKCIYRVFRKKKLAFAIYLLSVISYGYSQSEDVLWDHLPPEYKKTQVNKSSTQSSVIVIDEKLTFNFCSPSKTLQKTVLLKVTDSRGVNLASDISLPESFDIAENLELQQQGRLSKNKIPYIEVYDIDYFIARIIKPDGKVMNIRPEPTVSKVRWIKPTGEFVNDYVHRFFLPGIEPGDFLEYSYSVKYRQSYGSDILYLCSNWPKLHSQCSFRYSAFPQNKNYKFLFTSGIPDSLITKKEQIKDGLIFVDETIELNNVPRINYFIHASSVDQLPFVYFNMNFSIKTMELSSFAVASVPDFKWTNSPASSVFDSDFNIKRNTDVRKFLSKMPEFKNDTNNILFLTALNDTLNNYRYYSSNYLYYNDPPLYNLFSTEHLLKRRITDINLLELYENLLTQKGIFYYIVKIQDNRLGELNPLIRIGLNYENIILAVPKGKDNYTFIIPRYRGLKYNLDQLPFYFEGTTAAFFPSNYERKNTGAFSKQFKFIKTGQENNSSNVRTENCTVSLLNDSLCSLKIKQTLTGQFSTILTPYYKHDPIDSTISIAYFKKCTDKPFCFDQKISLKSKSEKFPFRVTVDCEEKIKLKTKTEIDMTNWFSFPFDKSCFSEAPTHDFFFDFPFTDIYNIELKAATDIIKLSGPVKPINDEYFEVSQDLKRQDSGYVYSVRIQVKRKILPKSDAGKLIDFINTLDDLNHEKLIVAKKE